MATSESKHEVLAQSDCLQRRAAELLWTLSGGAESNPNLRGDQGFASDSSRSDFNNNWGWANDQACNSFDGSWGFQNSEWVSATVAERDEMIQLIEDEEDEILPNVDAVRRELRKAVEQGVRAGRNWLPKVTDDGEGDDAVVKTSVDEDVKNGGAQRFVHFHKLLVTENETQWHIGAMLRMASVE